jgi:hypothetical protein
MGMRRHVDPMRAPASDDSGIALVLVVGVIAVMTILVTALLVTTEYTVAAGKLQETRLKKINLADAGLNAYLYELRRDSTYYSSNPTMGPVAQEDGVWVVHADEPSGTVPLTLRSTGWLNGDPSPKTVVATVRFPTFADFMFLSNNFINFGGTAVVEGKVRSNGYVTVATGGKIQYETYAGGTITGADSAFGYGMLDKPISERKFPNFPLVDFDGVTSDMESMKLGAVATGNYYADPGTSPGYKVVVSGTTYSVEKVGTIVTSTGVMSGNTVVATAKAIPVMGVLYFDSADASNIVWVSGNYDKPITIASAGSIYLNGTYTKTTAGSSKSAGLIAQYDIIVPTSYTSIPNTMIIEAGLLAQKGATRGWLTSPQKTSMTIKGSNSYFAEGYFVSGSTGWASRTYSYDLNLDKNPPPRYPVVREGKIKLNTWIED